jgi:IS605 OrfB family transposase
LLASFRVFEKERLEGIKWQGGCFAQDAVGDWWLCLPVHMEAEQSIAPVEAVGIDLGLKGIAATSDGRHRLAAGRWTRRFADKLASAQRRGHKRQAKRIHRKAARCRADALHKFSRAIVDQYQNIVVGDVSSLKLVKTRMAKSVLDSGWGMLKRFLEYKSQQAARGFEVVNERNTSVTCSACGTLSGPRGVCAVERRRFPVGARPTRQVLQPEATGATVEVTKRLKPSGKMLVTNYGGSASVQAAT